MENISPSEALFRASKAAGHYRAYADHMRQEASHTEAALRDAQHEIQHLKEVLFKFTDQIDEMREELSLLKEN